MSQNLKRTNPVQRFAPDGSVTDVCASIDFTGFQADTVTVTAAGQVTGGRNKQGVSTNDGVQLKSPDGSTWALQVTNAGIVVAVKV